MAPSLSRAPIQLENGITLLPKTAIHTLCHPVLLDNMVNVVTGWRVALYLEFHVNPPINHIRVCCHHVCTPPPPSKAIIQSTNRKTSFFKLIIARAHSSRLHGHQCGVPPKDSLMCHSAEKTKQFFFFALGYLIGLASVVFKPSSTKTATDLRDKGKTILFFYNFNSNLTRSLYKARTM